MEKQLQDVSYRKILHIEIPRTQQVVESKNVIGIRIWNKFLWLTSKDNK